MGHMGCLGSPSSVCVCFIDGFLWTSRVYLLPHVISWHYLVWIHMDLKITRVDAVYEFVSSVQRQVRDLTYSYWRRNICWRDAEFLCLCYEKTMLSEKTPCSMMAGTISSLPQHLVSIFQRIDNRCIFRAFLWWLVVIFQQLITCGHTSLHRYFCRIDLNDLPIIPHGVPGRFLNKSTVYVVCAPEKKKKKKKRQGPFAPFWEPL